MLWSGETGMDGVDNVCVLFLRGGTRNMGQRVLLYLVIGLRARLSDWKFDWRGVV